MAQTTMNIRIDEHIKKSFDEFCTETGLNASVAVNMFVRAVLRFRRIPFEITDAPDSISNERLVSDALIKTLLDRIEEGERTQQWITHDSVISGAQNIIANASNIKGSFK